MASISRLCVKGLPKHLTEDRLREHFESLNGEVTDVRICKTGAGVSRCFGFVGYKLDKDAVKAKRHFDNTFIDTSKIIVEIAKPVGDDSISRPWSKYSEGSSAHDRVVRKAAAGQENPAVKKPVKEKKKTQEQMLLEKVKSDPNLKAYVEAMKPRAKGKVWANEGDGLEAIKDVKQEAVRSKKAGGEDVVLTRTHVKFDGSDEESSDEEYQDMPADNGGAGGGEEAAEGGDSVAFSKEVDDLAYLKSKTTSEWKDSDDEDEDESDDEGEEEGKEKKKEKKKGSKEKKIAKHGKKEKAKGESSDEEEEDDEEEEEGGEGSDEEGEGEDKGADAEEAEGSSRMDVDDDSGKQDDDEDEDEGVTGRLFVRNLAFAVTEDDLRRTFGKFGELAEVHLCINRETKKPNGLAFILYLMPQHAAQAKAKLDGKFLQGRLLHIIAGKMPKKKEAEEGEGEHVGFKKKRDQKLKDSAGSSHNWNMLFMRSDTVADAAAKAHDMKKSDLLDAEADSMAVRMSLAETLVIERTKQKLAEEGVNVAAITVEEKPKLRSRNVMLVKNLPYSVEAGEIHDLFSRFGDVGRVVLPETKTMGIVEMSSEGEAKRAFKSLAYSRFKQQPLYLEWGPTDTFLSEAPPPKEAPAKAAAAAGAEGEGEGEGGGETATLYVKNIAFETSEAGLRKAVAKACGGDKKVKSVRVVTKAGGGKGGGKDKAKLSAGFAFVEFATPQDAAKAVGKLKGLTLDGKALQPELSRGGGSSEDGKKRKQAAAAAPSAPGGGEAAAAGKESESSKIVVRNVPFEATKKELKSLLGTFGQLATLRLPKKFDGKHRGFAFADFLTHQEAAAAKKALEGTHLYGRHLVIEYAEEDNSLEAIRLKTARYFTKLEQGTDGTHKRRKLQDALDEASGDEDFESNFV